MHDRSPSISPDDYERPRGRHIAYAVAFVVLCVIGIWTVMIPALEDAPADEDISAESSEESATDETTRSE